MQTQPERLTNLMDSIAGKIKLTDKIKCQATGPQLVAAPDESGQVGLVLGWQLTLWLDHNRLLGQNPVGVSVPIGTMLPSDEHIQQAVPFLLEEARKLRDKANNPVTAEPQDMAELFRKAQQDGQRGIQ